MKKTILFAIMFILSTSISSASSFRKHHTNINALSATEFELTDINFQNPHTVSLKNQKFFVVSVREPGSDGRVYAVDEDGTIWWHGKVSSGAAGGHETSNNIFHVLAKRRFHMSKTHPSANGVNNMDFEIQFTPDGQALHLGNTAMMSHGCIHVGRQDIAPLFKWSTVGMKVVVMRGHYNQFLVDEVSQFNQDIRDYETYMSLKRVN